MCKLARLCLILRNTRLYIFFEIVLLNILVVFENSKSPISSNKSKRSSRDDCEPDIVCPLKFLLTVCHQTSIVLPQGIHLRFKILTQICVLINPTCTSSLREIKFTFRVFRFASSVLIQLLTFVT